MRAAAADSVMKFDGILDETTSFENLVSLAQPIEANSPEIVAADLSKIQRANSTGIVTWLRFVKQCPFPLKYVNSPKWLVSQFNMINGFFVNGSYVESFQVPFFCPEDESYFVFTMLVGIDIPILDSYTNFIVPNRMLNEKIYEVDIEPELYFSFISQNAKIFREKI